MYRSLRGLGALGANECPGGYTFDGKECQPNAYDCITSSGKRGKSDGQGGCTYILQPSPMVTYPTQTSCPQGQVPTKGSPTGCAVVDWGQPCKDPWGNVGVVNVSGGCQALPPTKNTTYNPPVVNPQPLPAPPPSPVPKEYTKAERDADCKARYGNSVSIFYQGQWSCNVCNSDEVIDPADGACWCGPDKIREIPGNTDSPCVPRVNPQPLPQKSSVGKIAVILAVGIGLFAIGAMANSKEEHDYPLRKLSPGRISRRLARLGER